MAAAVDRLEPLTAPKMVQTAMLVCSSPPGTLVNTGVMAVYTRSLKPLRSRISPSSIKSGMALRVKELKVFQTASRAREVAPPAKKWRMNSPVRPSAAPRAAPDAALAVRSESRVGQNINQLASVNFLVLSAPPTSDLLHRY